MRVRVAFPDHLLDASTLDALLEATTRAGARQIRAGDAPDIRASLQRGLKWRPESFADGEHFDLPALAHRRGWGDCDDLGPWLAASLRASGDDKGARARATRSGPNRWHVVTQLSDGRVVDPSRAAGMGRGGARVSGVDGVHGFAAPPMCEEGDGAIALVPQRGEWWSRCDLPWDDGHLASLASSTSPEAAVRGAVEGALYTRDGCSREHAAYAHTVADALLRPPSVGSLFWGLGRRRNTALSTLVSGVGDASCPYATSYTSGPAYRAAIAHRPGPQPFWADPLVALMFSNGRARVSELAQNLSNVEPVLTAVDDLEGFHAGCWPAVSRSVEALASALAATGKFSSDGTREGLMDRAHILDALGAPVATLYDARVAAERPTSTRPRGLASHVQMEIPGGGHVTAPSGPGGPIIIRF